MVWGGCLHFETMKQILRAIVIFMDMSPFCQIKKEKKPYLTLKLVSDQKKHEKFSIKAEIIIPCCI